VNDLPGAHVADSAIEEIGTGSGRFRLIVTVQTWTNFTSLSLDNRGTEATGPLSGPADRAGRRPPARPAR